MTTDFYALISARLNEYPSERYGQAAFNALYEKYGEIVADLTGTEFDPFHDTGRVTAFIGEIQSRLENEK